MSETVSQHAPLRAALDEISRRAIADRPENWPASANTDESPEPDEDTSGGPAALLWAALSLAPSDGVPVADLVAATGMSHRWVNYRLRALADAGRAVQVRRGLWRTTGPAGGSL